MTGNVIGKELATNTLLLPIFFVVIAPGSGLALGFGFRSGGTSMATYGIPGAFSL